MIKTMRFDELRHLILDWAAERGILENGSAIAQLTKTEEEVAELREALENDDRDAMVDAYGDILVTLIIGADLSGLDIVDCLEAAYEEIKDRKGYLNEDGIFVKEEA